MKIGDYDGGDARDGGPRTDDERLHALLCAWILGEANAAEVAEVEKALAGSEELRAEKKRIESTVGLVRASLEVGADAPASGPADRLSVEATAALVAEARRQHGDPPSAGGRAWLASPILRAAAGTLLLIGVWGLYRASSGETALGPEDPLVARVDVTRKAGVDEEGFRNEPRTEEDGLRTGGRASSLEAEGLAADRGGARDKEPGGPAGGSTVRGARELAEVEQLGRSVTRTQTALEAGEPAADPQGVSLDRRLEEELRSLGYAGGKKEKVAAEHEALAAGLIQIPSTEESLEEIAKSERFLGYGVQEQEEAIPRFRAFAPVEDQKDVELGATFWEDFDGSTLVPPRPGVGGGGGGDAVMIVTGVPEPGAAGEGGGGMAGSRSVRYATGKGLPEAESAPGTAEPPAEDRQALASAGWLEPAPDASLKRARGRKAAGASDDAFFLGKGEASGAVPFDRYDRLGAVDDRRIARGHRIITSLGYLDSDVEPDPEVWVDRFFQDCRRRPHERPRDMFFRYWGDNPFELAVTDPFSTFSIDVDTASYALARQYLRLGILPEKAQVRTEEFVNYFDPDVSPPLEGTFRVETEMAPSLFAPESHADTWMLRVALRGREVAASERKPLALTFVVDVSGSMKEENRLELVKHAMRLLVTQMDTRDAMAIVAFSNESRLILPMTSAGSRGVIESAIHPLRPDGGTNAEAGLKMGYEVALDGFTAGSHNRVVLLSDGVANIGETDQDRIAADVRRHRKSGIYLNTIGVGMDNHNDVFLEQLADRGDGKCDYIDTPAEAERALVENFTGAFEPIARDVKIQVAFDPRQVERYRLLGYENRAIADEDFRNDAVDAGEVGAGHQVVALYELMLAAGAGEFEEPMARVHVRWKPPYSDAGAQPADEEAMEIAHGVQRRDARLDFASAGGGYRRSVLVAQLAEHLRRSIHARGDSLSTLLEEADRIEAELLEADTSEFVLLAKAAAGLLLRELARYDDLAHSLDVYREHIYLMETLRDLRGERAQENLRELEGKNELLKGEILRLLQEKIEAAGG